MNEFLLTSVFFGVTLTLFAYFVGSFLKKKLKLAIFNPILIATVLICEILLVFRIDPENYQSGAKYLSYFLTPATVCLAIPLYEQLALLRKNWKAVAAGILSGVLTSLGSVFALSLLFSLSHAEYVTLLPKSVTTAIGIGISEELGGYASITVAVIIFTGILGNMSAAPLCRLFRITSPVARGIAIGTSSHAIGTAKAVEMGETEGAASGLSVAVAGLLTVAGASVFAQFL